MLKSNKEKNLSFSDFVLPILWFMYNYHISVKEGYKQWENGDTD